MTVPRCQHRLLPDDIVITSEHDTDEIMETLDVEACWHGRRVGWALCIVKPNRRLLLCDIRVEDAVPAPPRLFGGLLRALGLLPRTLNFQGGGISVLLVLCCCKLMLFPVTWS